MKYNIILCLLFLSTQINGSELSKKPDIFDNSTLRMLPISFRNDGFSHYYSMTPPATKQKMENQLIAPLADSGVKILEWGLGPGSVFCYDTKIGDMFGVHITDQQWKMLRDGDRRIYENLKSLVDAGVDPLRVAVEYGHSIGLKVFARLEMQHEYGPVDSWKWVAFVGQFNKKHPEYRMPGNVALDFKHQAVRDFKLAILREAAERGFDGISADFCVRARYFKEPDKFRDVMTQFIRDIRAMLDEVGRKQGRRIELMIRVRCYDSYERGLDWKTCMKEGLIDYIVPGAPVRHFYLDPQAFIAYRDRIHSHCKVYGCLWQALGLVNTDPTPDGKQRYSKPKTRDMFFSQALLYNRAGCDGLQLALAGISQWRPVYGDLGNPDKVEFADKHYMVDVVQYMPISFHKNADKKEVLLPVADDIGKALQQGYKVEVNIVLYCRSLKKHETLLLSINENEPVVISEEQLCKHNTNIDSDRAIHNSDQDSYLYDPDWWRKGQKTITGNPCHLQLGTNTLLFEYQCSSDQPDPLEIRWVDLTVRYKRK